MIGRLTLSFVLLTASSHACAYLDAPAEKLTLPQLVKEFKSIEVVEVKSFDPEKGIVVWQRVEILASNQPPTPIKHLLKLRGKVPEALQKLAVKSRAVFFSQDGWKRGLIHMDGCWYIVDYEADSGWWRIAYTDLWYDFNTAFIGDAERLAAAVKQLLAGEDVDVRCRVEAKKEAVQTVRYNMKRLNDKKVIEGPSSRPSSRPGE